MSWDNPLFDSPFERRRLRVLSSIFSALSRCGAEPYVSGRNGREMSVLDGSIQVGCVLDDPKECERRDYPQSFRASDSRRPAGPLRFKIQSWWARPNTGQQWDDSSDIKLESMLTDIVVHILASGEITLRAWSQDRYEDAVKRRAEAAEKTRLKNEADERKEREQIAKLEQDRVDQLTRSAASWRQAGEIRAYVRAAMDAHSSSSDRAALEQWMAWALEVADRLDPLAREPSPIA